MKIFRKNCRAKSIGKQISSANTWCKYRAVGPLGRGPTALSLMYPSTNASCKVKLNRKNTAKKKFRCKE